MRGCSTPFGITADGTRGMMSMSLPSALCSTPFGITADGTDARGRGLRRGAVLNAFRHHG